MKKIMMIILMLAATVAVAQLPPYVISDMEDFDGNGFDDRLTPVSGWGFIANSPDNREWLMGTHQVCYSKTQSGVKIKQLKPGTNHVLSFRYHASETIKVIVFVSYTCGWIIANLPPANGTKVCWIEYNLPKQQSIMIYTALAGRPSWMMLDDILIDPFIDNPPDGAVIVRGEMEQVGTEQVEQQRGMDGVDILRRRIK